MIKDLFLVRGKDCKHSVVYNPAPSEKNPFVTSVYIARSAFTTMPSVLRLTIEDTSLTPQQAETHAATQAVKNA